MKATPVSLPELFHLAGVAAYDPVPDRILVTGITESTAEIKTGMLFVARRGTKYNGHDFLAAAAAKGACAAIVDQKTAPVKGLPTIRVAEAADALGFAGWLPVLRRRPDQCCRGSPRTASVGS